MKTPSQIAVSQLDRGMDLGSSHKNVALNHLVMRGTGLHACEETPLPEDLGPDPTSPGGPEWTPEPEPTPDTSVTMATWVEPVLDYSWSGRFGVHISIGVVDFSVPKAYVMGNDTVYCEECYTSRNEDRGIDHMDDDPSYWLFATIPWHPLHECECCGTKTGRDA